MRIQNVLLVGLFLIAPMAGCLGSDDVRPGRDPSGDAPFLDYLPVDPDAALELVETDHLFEGAGVEIHVRIKRPAGEGPFPVIAQFTPYTAPGENVLLDNLAEPIVGCENVDVPRAGGVGPGAVLGCEGAFDWFFARRGFAFAYGDVRGTGDSSGCLDLRGQKDIADLAKFTDWLGTQSWSNGNVGFIGGSYPGSEAHMAGIAGSEHLKAIVPVVASTSFYHYHHNDGVPYSGQHSLGGTNTGYTRNAIMPTLSPHQENYVGRYAEEASGCEYKENMLDHGGLDQSGAYYDWWQERNLRPQAPSIDVPVLMAQGLADWNVKPDHIASWFNDLTVANKTLIAGQWGHAYPYGVCTDEPNRFCDNAIPWGDWWAYVAAFFDTYLKEEDTGMFEGSLAWVQDSAGAWHRSTDWPLKAEDREELVFHFAADGTLSDTAPAETGELSWYGCPDDRETYGQGNLRQLRDYQKDWCQPKGTEGLVFETPVFAEDVVVSGVPLVDLTLKSEAAVTHLVVVVEVLDENGSVVERKVRQEVGLGTRENYGYLNPIYRNGIDQPEALPKDAYTVTIDLYPQEDVVKAGERLRVTVKSDDAFRYWESVSHPDTLYQATFERIAHRTIEAYEPGTNTILLGPDQVNRLWLPLRPADLQGTRLPAAESVADQED